MDGLVCSLCGFASAMLLELVYVLWLVVAVVVDSIEERLSLLTVGYLLLYMVVPYAGLLVIRCYTLMKCQAFRRSLRRSKEWRMRLNEKATLLKP